ncbi:EamA family transporter [Rhodoferax sp.]|uniref:DMT family transporter n=1 Tax=Rhodoferax sp. TaxID=50421 RepID=UPI002637411E|nr:EamA family transporter [Rhodoferax sp.]MDD2925445.1 EamA family transporter [Rhodoferax sp.]
MKHKVMTSAGMALAAAALWGSTGTAQHFAPSTTSAYWVGALRLLVASAFFAVFVAWRQRGQGLAGAPLKGVAKWIGIAGACMAAYNLTFFAGVKATGVATGTALAIGSGPIWAGLLQTVVSRTPPPAAWWLGTLLAIAGAVLLVSGNGTGQHIDPLGVALCLLAGLSYATYTLISKKLVTQAAPALITLWTFTVAAAIAVPAAALVAGPFTSSATGWVVVVYLGLVTTGVAYLLFSHALQHLSGATGVTLALAEPATAFVLAILVVGEQPQWGAFAGLGLLLTGLGFVLWTESRGQT